MYKLKANFKPAQEPKNGYIGKADLTIGDAIRIKDISVFEKQDGLIQMNFGHFGTEPKSYSYVAVPRKENETDEAYKARYEEVYGPFTKVITDAVKSDKHFAQTDGKLIYKDDLIVTGRAVKEPYADGRYTLSIANLCDLNGIATHVAKGENGEFVSVDMPTLHDAEGKVRTYENKEGKIVADHKFFGIKGKRTSKEGKEITVNYATVLKNKVEACRKEFDKSLDNQIGAADSQKEQQSKDNFVPNKEQER